ncbi:hypothetical protein [Sphingobacterium siyangense]
MLANYLNNFKYIQTKPEKIEFGFVLHKFYNCKLGDSTVEKIAFETFKIIKNSKCNFDEYSFTQNRADLILALEILEKNDFFDADLGEVLTDYDKKLIDYLSKSRWHEIQDLPFYLQLLINRQRRSGTPADPTFSIAMCQTAEKIIAYLAQDTTRQLNIANHLYALIQLYNLEIYTFPIEMTLYRILSEMELMIKQHRNLFSEIALANLLAYPILCKALSKKTKFNITPLIVEHLLGWKRTIKDINRDYFYLINTLLHWSRFTSDLKMKCLIEQELINSTKILTHKNYTSNHFLLSLTINSFLNQEYSSWDEILLTPRY